MASGYQLRLIASPTMGQQGDVPFPPGLASAIPASELSPAQTPDAYGMSLSVDGRIASGTAPTGTTRIVWGVTLSSIPYYYIYRRLWGITGTRLLVGAQEYTDIYLQHGPEIDFGEDTNAILGIMPFGPDFIWVQKSTGGYFILNAADSRGTLYMQRSPLIQEMTATTLARVAELDGKIYVTNTNGLYEYDYNRGMVNEVTRLIRDQAGATAPWLGDLTVDFHNKYIIAGTTFVYKADTQQCFRWSGTDFRFTTRQFHMPDWTTFTMQRVSFIIEHNVTGNGTLKYQVRVEDAAWGREETVNIKTAAERYTVIKEDMPERGSLACRRWQMRITQLTTGKYIKSILADGLEYDEDGFSE